MRSSDDRRSFRDDGERESIGRCLHRRRRNLRRRRRRSFETVCRCPNDVNADDAQRQGAGDDGCRESMFHWMLDEGNHRRMTMTTMISVHVGKSRTMNRMKMTGRDWYLSAEKAMQMTNVTMSNVRGDINVRHWDRLMLVAMHTFLADSNGRNRSRASTSSMDDQ